MVFLLKYGKQKEELLTINIGGETQAIVMTMSHFI